MTPAEVIATGLDRARRVLQEEGISVPDLDGKLLRPLVAWALVPPAQRAELADGFWCGALAIQMVHEASLLHDDILDGAERRRGAETTAAGAGVGPALLMGDLYLTGAYRAAAAGRPAFLTRFITAVERTVAGEAAQARQAGRRSSRQAYEEAIRGKSGALFGAAGALAATAVARPDHAVHPTMDAWVEFGVRMGSMYQRIDDLLDYCVDFETGKPPLQDYRQGKWTWILDLVDGAGDFSVEADEVVRRLCAPTISGPPPLVLALDELREERRALLDRLRALGSGDAILEEVIDGWIALAREAVAAQQGARASRARAGEATVRRHAAGLGGPEQWRRYFGRHAKTFHLASRLFPEWATDQVAGVYAFCRFTDDLVDDPPDGAPPAELRARLEAWRKLTEAAWDGHETGVAVLDHVIGGAARTGVSRRYPMALLDGVAMDLDRSRYRDWRELETYTFGVAGAVGGWLTQAFGLHDPALLERAHDLGHAMQLTNIARDVGEDLGRGRLYLPVELLVAHGLEPEALFELHARGGPLPDAYVAVMEAVLARADAYYARAWPAIGALPPWYRRPVAAAAAAYRGIHAEIRARGHDNLSGRAHTSTLRKVALAAGGIVQAGRRPAGPGLWQEALQ